MRFTVADVDIEPDTSIKPVISLVIIGLSGHSCDHGSRRSPGRTTEADYLGLGGTPLYRVEDNPDFMSV
ncbi:MAG: hypothetical protein ACP5K1_02160 [Candidatus Bathyarchaeia archaeon]